MNRVSLHRLLSIGFLAAGLALGGCAGDDGDTGPMGPPGADGSDGSSGPPGTPGSDGESGSARILDKHGEAYLSATELAEAGKYMAQLEVTAVAFPEAGAEHQLLIDFTVMNGDDPVVGLAANTVNLGVFKLLPPPADKSTSYSRWVPYLWRGVPSAAPTQNQGSRERADTSGGVFVDHGDGSYTYTFKRTMEAMAAVALPVPVAADDPVLGTAARAFDATKTHRVTVAIGGHNGPTGEATLDVVPDGSDVTFTRNLVSTEACKKCHGPEFHGHGGDRVTMEGCVTCHSPGTTGADGNDATMAVMTHKIHAGHELPTAPGPDGVFFDDPTTEEDESADNQPYTWTSTRSTTVFAGAFPAVLENCQACHYGSADELAQVNNWKSVPSRSACGACHDDVDWESEADHAGGAVTSDAGCSGASCHPADAGTRAVWKSHDFSSHDIRNIPEFDINLSVSAPANGKYFVAGETPVVTVVLKKDGVAIDHTTVVEDPAAEGCTPKAGVPTPACNETADGLFRNANMYVTGPRAQRIPVLTSSARAKVSSTAAGPWDLSAGGQSLRVLVDAGTFIVGYDPAGEDRLIPGDFTVKLPAAGTALNQLFADPAAATAAELVEWLMGDSAVFTYNERDFLFRDRAIAYVDENNTAKLAIRSRATIVNPSIQVPDASKSLGIFGQTIGVTGGASQLRARTNAANNDPKAVRTAANITYNLDPVDAYMPAGTYVVNVEFADMGRVNMVDNYRTPSIAVATFQIGEEADEKPIAGNCESCHWSIADAGFVLDYPRHNKPFNEGAIDQCGGCHDYASAESTATPTWTTGGSTKPISKRVHSIHYGSSLHYPVITVDHEESVPGRNWNITFPMDVRNCESCHPAGTTSGTWATNPNRLACMGCHDSDAATAHVRLNTWDPTPAVSWNGDEQEACAVCH